MKKLTMKDIGKLANVSQSTVSRVLSNHPNVKEEVRQRVLKCIQDNNFVPDISAKIMRGESSKILGFVSTNFANPYYLEMVNYVEKEARKNGYTVIVMNSEQDEKLEKIHFKELITRKVDGIISAPVTSKNLKLLKMSGIPFVVLNEKISWVDSFYTSLFNAGIEVAKYFKSKNYTKTAYIGDLSSNKLKGFLQEFKDEKINELMLLEYPNKYKYSELKKIEEKSEAIFFSSDKIALIFINELRKYGINIYEKELVGFDNTVISQTLGISSIEQPMENMCELAIKVLLEKINKKAKLDKIFNIELEPKLIIR